MSPFESMIFRKAPERWVLRILVPLEGTHPDIPVSACRPNPSSSRCGLQLSQDRIEVGFGQCESFRRWGAPMSEESVWLGLIPGLGDVVQWILCSLGHKCHSWNQSFFNWRCLLQELNDPVWLKVATWKLEASRTSHLIFCCKSPVRPHLSHGWNPVVSWIDAFPSLAYGRTELCQKKKRCLPRSRSLEWKVCHLKKLGTLY